MFSLIDKWPAWVPSAENWLAVCVAILLLLGLTSSGAPTKRVLIAVAATGICSTLALRVLSAFAPMDVGFWSIHTWKMGPRDARWVALMQVYSILAITGPIWLACERILQEQKLVANRWFMAGALWLVSMAWWLAPEAQWTLHWLTPCSAAVAGVLVKPSSSIAINLFGLGAGCIACVFSQSAILALAVAFAATQCAEHIKKPRSPEAPRSWRNGTY